MEDHMEPDDIEQLYLRQLENGGPIRSRDEWQQLLPAMYDALVRRAKTVSYDFLPVTYGDLGAEIGLPFIPDYLWWPLKMAHLLGACAKFEHTNGRPMLTSSVISNDTGQPGQGFWGIDGVPANLQIYAGHQEYLTGAGTDDQREVFWIHAMRGVDDFWKNHEVG